MQIVVPAEGAEQKIDDLPARVHLRPGELRIEFDGTEELLQRLFELSQAILNDYERFEEICGAKRRAAATRGSDQHVG